MGKFDGILICSDIDGTFRCNDETLKVNSDAVRYFIKNGGTFTFATGRAVHHLYTSGLCDIINAPACLCNGGIIYDYKENRLIREKRVDFSVRDFIDEMGRYIDENVNIFVFNGSGKDDTIICTKETLTDDILRMKPVKIYCTFGESERADFFKKHAIESELLKHCCICKSWSNGVEIDADDATKGHGIDYLKKYLGNIHTTVGIGDCENDIPLIKHADIGVAVGNAIDEVKINADIIVKPCEEYAIKDLIEILERKRTII